MAESFDRRTLLAALTTGSALLAGCSPLGLLNASSAIGSQRVREAVPYDRGRHPRRVLDLYAPNAAQPSGGWPMVLFFYGGSWNNGSRGDYRFVGEALAARGVVTAVADYRLYPEVRFPDFVDDCAMALAWCLGEAAGLDANPRQVFVMGHSAGAYNAAMLALDPRWLQAQGRSPADLAGWIGLSGPYDFLPIVNPDAQPVFHHPHYPPDSQPLALARAGAPRTFLGAANGDVLVNPQRNTVGLATRLRALQVPVEMHLYERLNHALTIGVFGPPLRWLAPVLADVSGFITAELRS